MFAFCSNYIFTCFLSFLQVKFADEVCRSTKQRSADTSRISRSELVTAETVLPSEDDFCTLHKEQWRLVENTTREQRLTCTW